jgi:hypothetical protein
VAVPAHGTSDLTSKIADVSRYIVVKLLFVNIDLGVRVKVNISWITDKS